MYEYRGSGRNQKIVEFILFKFSKEHVEDNCGRDDITKQGSQLVGCFGANHTGFSQNIPYTHKQKQNYNLIQCRVKCHKIIPQQAD